MEEGEAGGNVQDEDRSTGLSSQVLDYYKRFGRHRDLEQFFSLHTVQGEVRDPGSVFWRSMKTQPDSDDGRLDESTEVCRISISCTVADPSSSQEGTSTSEKQEPDSPPIISEELPLPAVTTPVQDYDAHKSDLDTSHKSMDINLDSSMNKPHSPTSSITSQRKLEWDSLADVGYANEHDRKASSTLSTLERLALQQQFSISDEIKHNISGRPTAYSTPLEADNSNTKGKKDKKGLLKKVTKISQKDVDIMELNLDRAKTDRNINFNLTKHISFNVDPETGAASVSNKTVKSNDFKTVQLNVTADAAVGTQEVLDKEIQTTLPGRSSAPSSLANFPEQNARMYSDYIATVPVFLNLDMLKQAKYRRLKNRRSKVKTKIVQRCSKQQAKFKKEKQTSNEGLEESVPPLEMTMGGSQVSETDSFEYMPAHVYQQNTARNNPNEQTNTTSSNKTSSLESSGGYTTLSSKQSEHSFTRDLEKGIALLNKLIQGRHQDASMKKKLVKEVVKGLIKTNYRDDEGATDFLSGLSFSSKILSLGNRDRYQMTTSTSDLNNSEDAKADKPRKPILRSPKSVKSAGSSTQALGDLSAQIHLERSKNVHVLDQVKSGTNFITESTENSSKEKSSSDSELPKTTSELLYQRYLDALRREEKYKECLKNKEEFLKHKLTQKPVPSPKIPSESLKASSLKDLLIDLTKSTGAGDITAKTNLVYSNPHSARSSTDRKHHSVFTISSKSEKKTETPSTSKGSDTEKQVKRKPVSGRMESQTIENINCIVEQASNSARIESHRSKDTDNKNDTTSVKTESDLARKCIFNKIGQNKEKASRIDDILSYEQIVALAKQESRSVRCNNAHNSGLGANNKYNFERNTLPRLSKFNSHYCCCPHHLIKEIKVDSATQFTKQDNNDSENLTTPEKSPVLQPSNSNTDFLCISSSDRKTVINFPENFLIYKCSRMPHIYKPSSEKNIKSKQSISVQCGGEYVKTCPTESHDFENIKSSHDNEERTSSPAKIKSDVIDKSITDPSVRSYPRDNFPMHTNFSSSSEQIHARMHTVPLISRMNKGNRKQSEATIHADSYIQTRVSIHPKISVPVLADINVLDDDYHFSQTYILPEYCSKRDFDHFKADTYPKTSFDKQLVVGHHRESTKYNKHQAFKRQVETDALLKAVLELDVSSSKSKDSQTSHQLFDDELCAFLCAKQSKSDANFPNTEECAKKMEEKYTSVTGLQEGEVPIPDDESASISRRTSVTQASSKSKEVSTQVTPRNNDKNIKSKGEYANIQSDNSEEIQKTDNFGINCVRMLHRKSQSDPSLKSHVNIQITKPLETVNVESQNYSENNGNENVANANDNVLEVDKAENFTESKNYVVNSSANKTKDTLLQSIENIIRRYAKDDKPMSKDKKKSRQKQCKEIINTLHYLLHTDNSDVDEASSKNSSGEREETTQASTVTTFDKHIEKIASKTVVDKATQLRTNSHTKQSRERIIHTTSRPKTRVFVSEDSSDIHHSSDMPGTSSDSLSCQIISKIKKECEKFHQKHCKCTQNLEHLNGRYDNSANRHRGDRHHHSSSKSTHQCINKHHKSTEKVTKPSIAYNLIIESTDSTIGDNIPEKDKTQLKNVIVKVPSIRKTVSEKSSKNFTRNKKEKEKNLHTDCEQLNSDKSEKMDSDETLKASRSSDGSESEPREVRKIKFLTVREYLERNRPDFVNSTSERQHSLRVINECRQRQQSAQRRLLSLQVRQDEDVSWSSASDLQEAARHLGEQLRTQRPETTFISERAMKEHSRKIYRSLPEVVQKKEKHKKDLIKKTNLVMTSLFNKNLQKRTLRGTVDISNYSQVIKI